MRAVVVGGQGFIGAEVCRELLRRGTEVTVLDKNVSRDRCDELFGSGAVAAVAADILDAETLSAAFAGCGEVYHMAGKLGTSELESEFRQAVQANIVGAINVFEAAVEAEVSTVFYPSKPNVWLNAYTITKHASEQFARLYAEYHPVRICSLRYFNAYGPRQALYPVRKIVPAFATQAMTGRPIEVYGDGEQTVDMVFAPDLGRITVDLARSEYAGEALDCGRGIAMTVNEVADAVNDFFGNAAGVVHVPMRKGEDPNTLLVAETASLEAALGPVAFADWDESLRETLEWYAGRCACEIDRALTAYGIH